MKESIENQVLGNKEPEVKKLNDNELFTTHKKYKVKHEKVKDSSIIDGETIKNILPINEKIKLAEGAKKLEYNGFIIEVIEETPTIEEISTAEETETVAPKPKKKKRVADD
jgi:hypothetical protein